MDADAVGPRVVSPRGGPSRQSPASIGTTTRRRWPRSSRSSRASSACGDGLRPPTRRARSRSQRLPRPPRTARRRRTPRRPRQPGSRTGPAVSRDGSCAWRSPIPWMASRG
ncbi:hypothetical protein ER308_06290 [Egibacter rhizosphaerae]|uniref:Uncharacterized protein n=1 Tax=Egibacter rhizosphaerae TaxID=1670831 RepID=A0A411YDA6_9ACTN|nr:hypothetical protein ER308_06290 [Egibacter rhizosphaerae]